MECKVSLVVNDVYHKTDTLYLQHIVHSVQTVLFSKLDGLPQSEIYEEGSGNVDIKFNSGIVPEILLP